MTNSTGDNVPHQDTDGNGTDSLANSTATLLPVHHMQKIFLQTSAAQGIAGAFAFAALILTCWQVNPLSNGRFTCADTCVQQWIYLVV